MECLAPGHQCVGGCDEVFGRFYSNEKTRIFLKNAQISNNSCTDYHKEKFTIMWHTFELGTIIQRVFLTFADDTVGTRADSESATNVVMIFFREFSTFGTRLVFPVVDSEALACRSINSNRSRKWGTSMTVWVFFCHSKRVPGSNWYRSDERLRGSNSGEYCGDVVAPSHCRP